MVTEEGDSTLGIDLAFLLEIGATAVAGSAAFRFAMLRRYVVRIVLKLKRFGRSPSTSIFLLLLVTCMPHRSRDPQPYLNLELRV